MKDIRFLPLAASFQNQHAFPAKRPEPHFEESSAARVKDTTERENTLIIKIGFPSS